MAPADPNGIGDLAGTGAALDRWRARRRTMVAVVVAAVGFWIAAQLPVEWVPGVELSALHVVAFWPGASPAAVERDVTAPIERVLQGVGDVRRIESRSEAGGATIRVETDHGGWDFSLFSAEIAERVASIRRELPPLVVPRLVREAPAAFRDRQGFMVLRLLGPQSPARLGRIAEDSIARRLRAIDGVAAVRVEGGQARALMIDLHPERLATFGVAAEQVRSSVLEAFRNHSIGRARWSSDAQRLVWIAGTRGADRLGEHPIAARGAGDARTVIRIADVATVAYRPQAPTSISRIDGQAVVSITVDRTPGSHFLGVAADVRRAVAALARALDDGVTLEVADDRSADARQAFGELAWRCSLGMIATILVLLAMLREGRAVVCVITGSAVALAVGLALLEPLGFSLNVVTLAALATLFGLLVDNATIVVEQVQHALSRRVSAAVIARRVRATVLLPLLGGTVTTIAVFVPMIFAAGAWRNLFAPFAVLATAALVASLIAALTLVSDWVATLRRRAPARGRSFGTRRPGRTTRWSRLGARVVVYAAVRPVAVVTMLVLLVGLPTPLVPERLDEPAHGWEEPADAARARWFNRTLGQPAVLALRRHLEPLVGGASRLFLTQVERWQGWPLAVRDEIHVRLRLPAGTELDVVDAQIRGFEAIAAGHPATLRSLVEVAGVGASLRVVCHPGERRHALALRQELVARAVQLGGIETRVIGLSPNAFYSGFGNVTSYRLIGRGPVYEDLEQSLHRVAADLLRDPRVARVDLDGDPAGAGDESRVMHLGWRAEQTARTRIDATELMRWIRPRVWTDAPLGTFGLEGAGRTPVRIGLVDHDDRLETLLAQRWNRADSRSLRLGDLVRPERQRTPPAIEKIDQRYRRQLEVLYRGPPELGKALIERTIARARMPPGYSLERRQPAWARADQARRMGLWIVASLGIVALTLAGVLESWRLAIAIMATMSVAWVGVVAAFVLTGLPFSAGAYLGIVLIAGISVNDLVLLAAFAKRVGRRRPALAPELRMALAYRRRFRPMWTTTLTTVAGLAPMVILVGDEIFWSGFALTVIGGLSATTLAGPIVLAALLGRRC